MHLKESWRKEQEQTYILCLIKWFEESKEVEVKLKF